MLAPAQRNPCRDVMLEKSFKSLASVGCVIRLKTTSQLLGRIFMEKKSPMNRKQKESQRMIPGSPSQEKTENTMSLKFSTRTREIFKKS